MKKVCNCIHGIQTPGAFPSRGWTSDLPSSLQFQRVTHVDQKKDRGGRGEEHITLIQVPLAILTLLLSSRFARQFLLSTVCLDFFFWFRMLWLVVSCLNLAIICKIGDVCIRFCSILSRYECIVVLVFPKIEPFLMASWSSTFTNWNATHLDTDRLRPAFGDERYTVPYPDPRSE